MKKIKILAIFVFLFFSKNVFGISNDFKFVIDTVGVPRYNVYGYEINEDTYNKYNVFCYGKPTDILNNKGQNFKKISRGFTTYKGVKGEHRYLGFSYSGSYVSNYYYPVDIFYSTTPNNFNYIEQSTAKDSWNNMRKGQYEYMKTTELLIPKIDFENKTTDIYNQVGYGLRVSNYSNGMNIFKVNTPSTWKSRGVVTANFLSTKVSGIRYIIFATSPMAASAEIKSYLNTNDIVIEEDEIDKKVKINFGANVNNLNGYATKEQIKEIVSVIYINGKEIAKISGSKTDRLDKNIVYTVSRDNYSKDGTYPLDIKVKSYLYTEFYVDGLLTSELDKVVNLVIKNKKINPVTSTNMGVIYKNKNDDLVVSPLVQTNISKNITENGRYIAIKFKHDKHIDIKSNTKFETIYSSNTKTIIKVLMNLPPTLKSWSYLRNNNYFNIDFNEVGNRISNSHILKFIINDKYIEEFNIDIIDDFNNNINYILDDVINEKELKSKVSINSW